MRKEVAREDIFHNVSNGEITIFAQSSDASLLSLQATITERRQLISRDVSRICLLSIVILSMDEGRFAY